MIQIDYAAIEAKVLNYANSDKGKAKMRKKMQSYINKNAKETDAGSPVINKAEMSVAAEALIKFVKQMASSSDVAGSVLADISTLTAGRPVALSDGSYQIELSFKSDLSRPSLMPEKYGGVTNIIALFNNGYPKDAGRSSAISYVDGMWHGKFTRALPYREPLGFMQSAVEMFNWLYGEDYNVTVTLNGIYEQ